MGRVCGMRGAEQRCLQCLVGNLTERDRVKQVSVCGRIILKWIIKMGWEGLDRIREAQDCDSWWAFENTVMTFGFHELFFNPMPVRGMSSIFLLALQYHLDKFHHLSQLLTLSVKCVQFLD
jgi:hypothetical protein